MVNYAWEGQSQKKLWWRTIAILMCKSVVRPGYREGRKTNRTIELLGPSEVSLRIAGALAMNPVLSGKVKD